VAGFHVPGCARCADGILKPAVVFFGGSLPKPVSERARALADAADGALVVGSSLQTYSAFRLARAVAEAGKPLAIVNVGPTRADALATLRIECDAVDVLPAACKRVLA
jgi:NAD-dependent SIR2 family protein deacetylase